MAQPTIIPGFYEQAHAHLAIPWQFCLSLQMEYIHGNPNKMAKWNSWDIFSDDSESQLTRLK